MKKPKNFLTIILFYFILTNSLFAQNQVGKTQIMVLGSYHLSQLKEFDPQMLDQLITQLDAYHFDAVCIEKMPGELLYDLRSRKDTAYKKLLKSFGGGRLEMAELAQKKLGISFTEAQSFIKKLIHKESLKDEDHQNLIEYFTAATELASATLHYKYLKNKSSLIESNIDTQILKKIKKLSTSSNEVYSLAIGIAQNQNIQKLEYIDNLQDETLHSIHFPMFVEDYMKHQDIFKEVANHPVFQKMDKIVETSINSKNLLKLYQFTNSKEYQNQDFEAQWALWLNTHFKSGSDWGRYSLWEMRNLQITANILKTSAFYPNKKMLVIIGASHKSFIEKYLAQLPNIEILQFVK